MKKHIAVSFSCFVLFFFNNKKNTTKAPRIVDFELSETDDVY